VESCDVYFYKVGRRLGVDKIAEYAHRFGLGEETDFDLGNERPGLIPTTQWKLKRLKVPWQAGETISTSIGQSFVLVTPLQMARMISAVFNGGYLYQPKIVRSAVREDGKVQQFEPTIMSRINARKENLERIKSALIGVVNEPHGTGAKARIGKDLVAGKTGTAQVVNLDVEKSADKGRGTPQEYVDHAWFVAIAPAEDPQLAVSVLIENGGHGGSAAAPIAGELIKAFLNKRERDGSTIAAVQEVAD